MSPIRWQNDRDQIDDIAGGAPSIGSASTMSAPRSSVRERTIRGPAEGQHAEKIAPCSAAWPPFESPRAGSPGNTSASSRCAQPVMTDEDHRSHAQRRRRAARWCRSSAIAGPAAPELRWVHPRQCPPAPSPRRRHRSSCSRRSHPGRALAPAKAYLQPGGNLALPRAPRRSETDGSPGWAIGGRGGRRHPAPPSRTSSGAGVPGSDGAVHIDRIDGQRRSLYHRAQRLVGALQPLLKLRRSVTSRELTRSLHARNMGEVAHRRFHRAPASRPCAGSGTRTATARCSPPAHRPWPPDLRDEPGTAYRRL